MKRIKIFDNLFAHAKYSTDYQESKYIIWDRGINNPDIAFYTDSSLSIVNKNINKNFAWLLESPAVTRRSYEWISKNHDKFDKVFTHNKELLNISDKFKFSPTGGCWIKLVDQKIYEKSRLISTITSEKQYLKGHSLRHEIIKKFKNIDVFGRGYTKIEYKLRGLKDYMFSFAIENVKEDYYFSEKLIDCFMTGTVPIYWGCPSIGNFFNIKGMILFDDIDDLENIMNDLTKDKYDEMKPYIEENFEKAKNYLISEDYIWENYFMNDKKEETKMNYLLSYPRSGNHWVRFIIEFLTGRPSLGCKTSEDKDKPIYQTNFNGGYKPIKIEDTSPIIRKSHSPGEIMDCDKLIVIVREYKECIIRHNSGRITKKDIDVYYNIIKFYDEFNGDKLLIKYNDLLNNNENVAQNIFEFLECDNRNKLKEFLNNVDVYRIMNRNVTGRFWQGSISGDDLNFHKSKFHDIDYEKFDQYVDEKYKELKNRYDL